MHTGRWAPNTSGGNAQVETRQINNDYTLQVGGMVRLIERGSICAGNEESAAPAGMLLHINGSKLQWFGDERWQASDEGVGSVDDSGSAGAGPVSAALGLGNIDTV